jgi:acetyl esterase/lipase
MKIRAGWLFFLCVMLLALLACKAEASPTATSSVTASPSPVHTPPATTLAPSPPPGPEPAKLGTVVKDVIYGNAGGVALKLDIYYPKTAAGAIPAVVYVHGGGWTSGDKAIGAGAEDMPEMVNRGYLTVSINYRLAPQYKFPAQIEDAKCAIRFLKANASVYGINPDRIGVWGGSAGGHLVALLGTTDASAGMEGSGGYPNQSSRVRAVVDMFGPSDLTALFRLGGGSVMQDVFGTSDINSPVLKTASPVTYITPDDPPFLILHGDKDTVVPLSQSQILYNQLKAGGVTATLVVVKNSGHGFVPSGGAISPTRAEITAMVADFYDKYLK